MKTRYGFCKKRSCETQLIITLDDLEILNSLGEQADVTVSF